MNVWQWIVDYSEELGDQGEYGLARDVVEIGHHAVEDRFADADAAFARILTHARHSEHKWLEVFARHWNMQSRSYDRGDCRENLNDAIALLEFASRDDTRDCPQSICVVQDLCRSFDELDGPGYAEERLAVTGETLDRISPAWNCWGCISRERASALEDLNRFEESLAFLQEQASATVKYAADEREYERYYGDIGYCNLQLGRLREAARYFRLEDRRRYKQGPRDWDRQKWCWLLTLMGRYRWALKKNHSFAEIKDKPGRQKIWCEIQLLLAKAGQIPNNADLKDQFRHCLGAKKDRGAIRGAFNIAHEAGKLAILRDDVTETRAMLAEMESLFGGLNRPRGADRQIAELRDWLEVRANA
ncbi:MAG: tetratricopeptide repeat protein [bacterium]|nr:tetratricopeptide repeat protein [bacterium]